MTALDRGALLTRVDALATQADGGIVRAYFRALAHEIRTGRYDLPDRPGRCATNTRITEITHGQARIRLLICTLTHGHAGQHHDPAGTDWTSPGDAA